MTKAPRILVAVKISTGEPGGHNFLQPSLIGKLVGHVNGTIVECNTAYGGRRGTTEEHLQVAREHGLGGKHQAACQGWLPRPPSVWLPPTARSICTPPGRSGRRMDS